MIDRIFKVLILIVALLSIGGCMQNKDIPTLKEGDIVKWRGNQLLIIKAVLGQRRLHIEKNLGYALEHENFIGQFPIDYEPSPFPKLTEKEVIALESAENERLKELHHPMHNDIEFNLMLNGSTVVPTDTDPIDKGVDHPDQVKVRISRYELHYSDYYYKHGELINSYKGKLSRWVKTCNEVEGLNLSTKTTKEGVDCYEYQQGAPKKDPIRECFVQSDNPLAPNYQFTVPSSEGYRKHIQVNRYMPGYTLFWYTDKKNIYRAKEIDAAIWRLIDIWNVSPYQAPAFLIN